MTDDPYAHIPWAPAVVPAERHDLVWRLDALSLRVDAAELRCAKLEDQHAAGIARVKATIAAIDDGEPSTMHYGMPALVRAPARKGGKALRIADLEALLRDGLEALADLGGCDGCGATYCWATRARAALGAQ